MTTLTNLRVALILISSLFIQGINAQDTLYLESFENITLSLNTSTQPCFIAPDLWDKTLSIDTITAYHSSNFWGVRDLNGNCGGTGFESLATDTFDLSNYSLTSFSFSYFFFEFDNGDDIKYQLTLNHIVQPEVLLVDGSADTSSNAWEHVTIPIHDTVNSFHFKLMIKQNGDNDYAGFDYFHLLGLHQDSCHIFTPTIQSITCNNNGTTNNALDDFNDLALTLTGQNLANHYSLYEDDVLISDTFSYSSNSIAYTLNGSVFSPHNYLIVDSVSSNCTVEFLIDSTSHCSNNYNLTLSSFSTLNLNVDCNFGDSILVECKSFGKFDSTNVFSFQLYDSLNQTIYHSNPVLFTDSLDTLIYVYIPHALQNNGSYTCQLQSSYPFVQSSLLSFQVSNSQNCTPPYITGILINACGSGLDEGKGELLFGYTGDYPLLFSDSTFQFYYGVSDAFTTLQLKIDVFTDEPSNTLLLNSAAGCANLFLDGYNTVIPKNSRFMICRNDIDVNSLLWNNLCGQGPIYVLYADPLHWIDMGLFSHVTTPGIRYMQAMFIDTLNHIWKHNINYNRIFNSGFDGDFLTFSSAGGEAITYDNLNCSLIPAILPITLLDFYAEYSAPFIHLGFEMADEHLFTSYRIEKFEEDHWNMLQVVYRKEGNGMYTLLDYSPSLINNYRLFALKENGDEEFLGYTKCITKESDKKIIARTNLLGQHISAETKGWQIIRYSDNTTAKHYVP